MTWEYSGDPATSSKDAVRFLIGDTDDASPQLQDEEIDWTLTQELNIYLAAAMAADTIAANYSSLVDKSVGSLSLSYGSARDSFHARAAELREAATRFIVPTPEFTGLLISEKASNELDTDIEHALFKLGQMDNLER